MILNEKLSNQQLQLLGLAEILDIASQPSLNQHPANCATYTQDKDHKELKDIENKMIEQGSGVPGVVNL